MESRNNKPNSEAMRKLWEESGLSYRIVADLAGIKPDTFASWVFGKREPPSYALELVRTKLAQLQDEERCSAELSRIELLIAECRVRSFRELKAIISPELKAIAVLNREYLKDYISKKQSGR